MIALVRDRLESVSADAYGCLPTASDHEAFQTMLNDQAAWSGG